MPPRKQPWFRFYVEAIWDLKIRSLSPAHRWLWVAVLAMARSSPQPGILLLTERVPVKVSDLADAALLKSSEVTKGLVALEDLGLIAKDASGAWAVVRWAERQFESDLSRPFISDAIRTQVFAKDNYECVECGAGENLSIDHIVPITKGGTSDLSNLQTMCVPCNARKGNRERQREYRSRKRNATDNGEVDNASRDVTHQRQIQRTDTDSEAETETSRTSENREENANPRPSAAQLIDQMSVACENGGARLAGRVVDVLLDHVDPLLVDECIGFTSTLDRNKRPRDPRYFLTAVRDFAQKRGVQVPPLELPPEPKRAGLDV